MSDSTLDERTLGALAFLARAALSEVDYLGQHRATVVSQNADGTCEVKPDDPRIPPTSKVPVRYGAPGQSVKLAAGARAIVSFERRLDAQNQPEFRLVVVGWEAGEVDELEFKAATTRIRSGVVELGVGASRSAAAVGDFAQFGGALPLQGVATFGVPGGPATPVVAGTPFPVLLQFPVPIMAPIVSGSGGVKVP